MKFSTSLKKNFEFRRLYSKGKSTSSALAAVYCRKNRLSRNRVGITVSTKIGHAVVRNRIRRRFREIYRLNEERFACGYDIVIVARVKSRYVTFSNLQSDLLQMCQKLGIYNGDCK
jgi:ribonuclease P protein component